MKIKITKLKEVENPRHPNNIEEGYTRVGTFINPPEIGQRFGLSGRSFGDYWSTSPVQEIIDENTFRTLNSVYRWEVFVEETISDAAEEGAKREYPHDTDRQLAYGKGFMDGFNKANETK